MGRRTSRQTYHIEVNSRFGAGGIVLRPNKTSAGMTATDARRPKNFRMADGDVLTLQVRGTLDKLGTGLMYKTRSESRGFCPCCGAERLKRVLSDSGRIYLRRKRREKATGEN